MSLIPPAAAKQTESSVPQVRVMIVDDSVVIRGFIARALEADPSFKVVMTASNGQVAIDALRRQPADVIILDIEMPVMNGLDAIPKLKEIDPAVQIIMASTLTHKNAEVSLKAMSLGATDYLPKPSAREMAVPNDFQRDLCAKVKELGIVARRRGTRQSPQIAAIPTVPLEKKKIALRALPAVFRPDVIAIGSSTGGPQALFDVIKAMGPDLPQPILITQHMPPSFTTILAEHISRQCGVTCAEAKEGETLRPGIYYIAPGDFHMLAAKSAAGPSLHLTQEPPENYCRPAVDPMLRSLVELYGGRVLAVILTGMGSDGAKGCINVSAAGGVVIAQDEATSVVWGMPGAAAASGVCSLVMPVGEIGAAIKQMAVRGTAGLGGRA